MYEKHKDQRGDQNAKTNGETRTKSTRRLLLAAVAEQAGLILTLSHSSDDRFSLDMAHTVSGQKSVPQFAGNVLVFDLLIEPPHYKTNEMAYTPSEDSDQPEHPPSLIRVFAVPMKKTWVLSHPLSASEDSDQTGRMPMLI